MAGIKFNRIFAHPKQSDGKEYIVVEIPNKEDAEYLKTQTEVKLNHPNYKGKYKIWKVTNPNPNFAYSPYGHAGFNEKLYLLYLETPFNTPKTDMNYKQFGVRWRIKDTSLNGSGIVYTDGASWGSEDKNNGEITVESQGQSIIPPSGGNTTNSTTPVNPFTNIEQQIEQQISSTPEADATPFYKKKWFMIGVPIGVVAIAVASYFIFRKKK